MAANHPNELGRFYNSFTNSTLQLNPLFFIELDFMFICFYFCLAVSTYTLFGHKNGHKSWLQNSEYSAMLDEAIRLQSRPQKAMLCSLCLNANPGGSQCFLL